MSKITEAQEILRALGLPVAQQNEMSALTLLALCGIKENTPWANASRSSQRITKGIMAFVNENYKGDSPYAPNTREIFRRQVLHQFIQAGVVNYNPDAPCLPVNSPRAHYAITEEALEVVKSYGARNWDNEILHFSAQYEILREKYAAERNMNRIPLIVEGREYYLSPGVHNEVQASVVTEFASRFAPGGKLLYIGDTEDKDLYINSQGLETLHLPVTEHSKLPDIIISDDKREWLFLIEVVTSHGPVSAKRLIELEDFTKDCPYGIVYVTAFPNAKEFKKHVADIAWETEVWLSDTPDHMIHFNGDRFIGPRRK
ncbi:MAG: restriction endonuclease [Bacteroidales bacterium]|nr:restriction endonuclease [Bacteroidales bacterium]